MSELVADGVLVIGVVLICVGAYLRYGAAGLILAGAVLAGGSLMYARGSR